MESRRPILTIGVPTYNRARYLARLLGRLAGETRDLGSAVELIVSDNASTDDTSEVIDRFLAAHPLAKALRHEENLGAEENFCRLIEAAQGSHIWLIGDDDLPVVGTIRLLLELLRDEAPAAVFLRSGPTSSDEGAGVPLQRLQARRLSSAALLRHTNVYLTFVSAWIIRADALQLHPLRRFLGSNLIHTGWIIDAVASGDPVVRVGALALQAEPGNSGGYGAMKVFGSSFPRLTRTALPEMRDAAAVIRRSAVMFLPGLAWGVRRAKMGRFDTSEQIRELDPNDVGGRAWRDLILGPILSGPVVVAVPAAAIARAASGFVRIADALRPAMRGAAVRPRADG